MLSTGRMLASVRYEKAVKQAEPEVVPSSSLTEIEVEVGVEFDVGVKVDVGVEVEVRVEVEVL